MGLRAATKGQTELNLEARTACRILSEQDGQIQSI